MSSLLRRSFLPLAATLAGAAIAASACSGSGTSDLTAAGTTGSGPATIGIETSSLYLTVSNQSGAPLVDLRVTLQPVGNPMTFSANVQRLENGQKRDIPLGTLRSNDGTTFSPRIYRPKQVTVTAKDIVGKAHERTVPWKG